MDLNQPNQTKGMLLFKSYFIFVFAFIAISVSAQQVAIKTNILYDATTTPNLALEIGSAR